MVELVPKDGTEDAGDPKSAEGLLFSGAICIASKLGGAIC